MAEPDPGEDFRRLFERSARNLLAQAYFLTGDHQESQDLVQEVLLRAWRNWERISVLDNQDAWLRRVLYNLSANRRRSLRIRRRRLLLVRTAADSPAPGVEHLDVMAALRSVPAHQQQALILVAIFGLTTAEAAAEMKANEGTIRVWVSRGRAALARALDWDLNRSAGR